MKLNYHLLFLELISQEVNFSFSAIGVHCRPIDLKEQKKSRVDNRNKFKFIRVRVSKNAHIAKEQKKGKKRAVWV